MGGRNVFKFAVKWVYSQIERKFERDILIGKEREVRYRKKWGNGSYSLVMGKGVGFDSTEYNLQPISWKSKK